MQRLAQMRFALRVRWSVWSEDQGTGGRSHEEQQRKREEHRTKASDEPDSKSQRPCMPRRGAALSLPFISSSSYSPSFPPSAAEQEDHWMTESPTERWRGPCIERNYRTCGL